MQVYCSKTCRTCSDLCDIVYPATKECYVSSGKTELRPCRIKAGSSHGKLCKERSNKDVCTIIKGQRAKGKASKGSQACSKLNKCGSPPPLPIQPSFLVSLCHPPPSPPPLLHSLFISLLLSRTLFQRMEKYWSVLPTLKGQRLSHPAPSGLDDQTQSCRTYQSDTEPHFHVSLLARQD